MREMRGRTETKTTPHHRIYAVKSNAPKKRFTLKSNKIDKKKTHAMVTLLKKEIYIFNVHVNLDLDYYTTNISRERASLLLLAAAAVP